MPDLAERLEYTYHGYEADNKRWQRALDHYRADVFVLRSKEKGYLVQRNQGEPESQFNERRELADYTPIISTIVNTYAGRILALESEFQRNWPEDIMGTKEEEGSIASRLWRDADGKGGNYLMIVQDMTVMATTTHTFYVVVEGFRTDSEGNKTGLPSVKIVEPTAVTDKAYDSRGQLLWAKVKHQVDARDSWQQKPDIRDRYTIYERDGYEVFEVIENEDDEKEARSVSGGKQPYGIDESGENPFFYYRTKDRNLEDRILPIFEVKVPLRQPVGSILAEKNNILFNQVSERDNVVRIANTPKLVFAGQYNRFKKVLNELKAGDNVLRLAKDARNKHYYMEPGLTGAQVGTEIAKDKRQTIFLAGFRFYEDAVKPNMTATEVQKKAEPGRSFLHSLASTIDDAENGIGWRLAQILAPQNPEAWPEEFANRGTDFDPVDPETENERIARQYFGGAPPISKDFVVEKIKQIHANEGVEIDDAEAEELAEDWIAARAQAGQIPNPMELLRQRNSELTGGGGGPGAGGGPGGGMTGGTGGGQAAEQEGERASQELPEGA